MIVAGIRRGTRAAIRCPESVLESFRGSNAQKVGMKEVLLMQLESAECAHDELIM